MRVRVLLLVVAVVLVVGVVSALLLTSGGEPEARPEPAEVVAAGEAEQVAAEAVAEVEAEIEAPELVEEVAEEEVAAEAVEVEEVPPCENGIAVEDPEENPGLVRACEVLLAAKDALAGEGGSTGTRRGRSGSGTASASSRWGGR